MRTISIFLLTTLFAPHIAFAQAAHNTPLDEKKRWAEDTLKHSGQSIDRFITQRILRKKDEDFSQASANARITVEAGYFENGTLKSDVDFDVSLVLPRSREHLRLFAGGEKSYFDHRKHTEDRLEKTNAQAGLQYTFDAIREWNPRLRTGIHLQQQTLNPFTELKLKRQIGSNEHHLYLSQSGKYSRLEKMVYTTQIDSFNTLTDRWHFRFANQFQHRQIEGAWFYQHSPIFTRSFSKHGHWINQLTLSGQEGEARPYTQITLSTRVIHPIFRPWILLEIEPVHTHSLVDDSDNNALFFRTHFLLNR